jgi:hypothetical protein
MISIAQSRACRVCIQFTFVDFSPAYFCPLLLLLLQQALFQPVAAPSDTLNCAELHESGAFGGQQAIGDADAAAEPEVRVGRERSE